MKEKLRKGPRRPDRNAGDRSPLSRWLLVGGGFAVLLVLIVVVLAGTLNEPTGGVPEGTEEIQPGEALHVETDLYEDDEVPVGGEHSSLWANCGFYSEPVTAENAVHSLEHGAVWVTYAPGLPDAQVETLRNLGSPTEKVLVSPVANQESPVVATAWGHRLELKDAGDPRLSQFVVEFAGSLDAPEPGGRCTGGVGTPG